MDDPSLIFLKPSKTKDDHCSQDTSKELASMADHFLLAEVSQAPVHVSSLHHLKNHGVLTFKKPETSAQSSSSESLKLRSLCSEVQKEKKADK